MHKQAYQTGVTLLELLVTVTIIGIIAAFAIPSYTEYVCDSRKTDATTALIKMAQLQEQYNLQNGTYATSASIADVGGSSSPQGYYSLAITSASAADFLLTATDVQASAAGGGACDPGCVNITLNAAGARAPASCWK